jgi:hypothetical protein
VIDGKLSPLGLKDIQPKEAIQIATQPEFAAGEGRVTIDIPGEYEVSNVSVLGIAATRHIDYDGSKKTTTTTTTTTPEPTTTTTPRPTTTTTTTTPTPITYKPIIRFVPSALSFNVDPNSTLIINVRSDTTYQIEVIGMKPNGSFYFNLGDFLGSPAYRWNTQPIFSAKGIDPNNIQADINGHWSMNITIPAGTDVEPNGYMRIAGFGSKDPNVNDLCIFSYENKIEIVKMIK